MLDRLFLPLGSLVLIAWLPSLVGCSKSGAFDNGDTERKPGSPGIVQQTSNATSANSLAVARANYEVVVRTNSTGMEFCKGRISLTISTGSFVPEGTLQCISVGRKIIPLDLGALMKGYGQGEPVKASDYPEAGMVYRKPNAPSGPQFDPPRIFSVALLVQNPAIFENYVYRENASVTFKGQQDQGSYFVEVHNPKMSFTPPKLRSAQKFDNVMHYTVKTVGFKKFPRSELDSAMEHFEMYYNTRPIAIPKIIMKSKVGDLLPGKLGDTGQAFFSGLTIEIDLLEHIPID